MRWRSFLLGGCLLIVSMLSAAQTQTAAYIRGASAPWGVSTNEAAMDKAFGAGLWADLRMAGGPAPFLPASGYRFIYLEGGDLSANELVTYLSTNRTQIEAFVNSGGRLFLNSAPNQGGNINFGFGGITLTYPSYTSSVVASNAAHPVFLGPITPVSTAYTGTSFGHAVVGVGVSPVIIGAIGDASAGLTVLGEKRFGSGCVAFGGMTTDNFQAPQPNANNLRANILKYVASGCSAAPGPVSIPTLSEWGMTVLSALMIFGAFFIVRRRQM